MEILILVLTVVISIIVVASVIAARIQLKNTKHFSEIQQSINDRQVQNLLSLQETLRESLAHQSKELAGKFDKLTDTADQKLQQISGQVEKRLSDGFEKTNKTFTDIIKRLALIDDAQKKLGELSTNVISLQDILNDKRSRGAFGEVQLKNLIENMLPKKNFSFQHQMSNNTRADCMLFLPEPTGNIVIDSKFPLENYQKFTSFDLPSSEKQKAQQNFKQDIKKHINDIADKYIIAGETTDGAIMFLPAEAIFAELHREFSELITYAHQRRVWITSPTTMMAVLTTASAVLKDSATREHIHIIQEHLGMLAKDFSRFDDRMQKLAKHIDQAHEDVQQVNTSAQKITQRFKKIEEADVATLIE